jgi:hypothetical protein
VAKNGYLEIDTPIGSIRGRAHAAGIGSLSLVALIFSAMNEVQAADPNITFMDDDFITYKDLEHGTFELVTKEAIPPHSMVENPGETIELSRKGSSIDVNQSRCRANAGVTGRPAGRASQSRRTNGSSTSFLDPLPVQPQFFPD